MKKATDEQIVESYKKFGSIWKVAKEYSMCGQGVWERLRRLGVSTENKNKWTDEQIKELIKTYLMNKDSPIDLESLAKRLGKLESNICRKARSIGLKTNRGRKVSEKQRKIRSENMKKWIKENGHPRGNYKGGKQLKTCLYCGKNFKVFPGSKQKYCSKSCTHHHPQSQKNQGYSKSGKRKDLNNQYFRSRYEANYARYLNFAIKNDGEIERWEFESETFEFKNIKRGTRFYTPDFKVYFKDGRIEYHEVKGWDYPKGITARKRFSKYYPELKLVLISKEWFAGVKRHGMDKLIPGWEKWS